MQMISPENLGLYDNQTVAVLQTAYNLTCQEIGICPITSADRDMIARMVLTTYDSGVQRPDRIASLIKLVRDIG